MQAPLLAYTHFLEALFVLNGCRAGLGHALHAGAAGDAEDACSLLSSAAMARCCPSGPDRHQRQKRAAIYE